MENNHCHSFYRLASPIAHLTFFVLTGLALYFFRERTLILDAAFQSFEILKKDSFAIQVMRFGAAMTQVFPLCAAKLGAGLPVILKSYSLAFVLVQWGMYAICERWLRVSELALGILLFNLLLVSHTFFWVQNEVIQGTSLCLVFWAMLLRRQPFSGWLNRAIAICLIVTLVFFHPLVAFSFLYLCLFFSLCKPALVPLKTILPAAAAFLVIFFIKTQLIPKGYDAQTMNRLHPERAATFFKTLQSSNGLHLTRDHLWPDMALLPALLALILLYYFWKKQRVQACFTFASVVVFTVVVLISYQESKDWFHMESQFLPLSIFLAVPLIFDVLPGIIQNRRTRNACLIALAGIVVFRLAVILHTSRFYTERVEYIAETLEKTKNRPGTKFMMKDTWLDQRKLLQVWSFAYESLYYSTLQSPDSTRSILVVPDIHYEAWRRDSTQLFHSRWDIVPYRDMPPQFHFTDTTGHYLLLDSAFMQQPIAPVSIH